MNFRTFAGTVLAFALGAAPAAQAQPAETPITLDAVLGVSAGMTVPEARAALPDVEWVFEPVYMIDFSALCAEREEKELFCALILATDAPGPKDRIETIAVANPSLATRKGVRVGMLVSAAEEIYGDARLTYSLENESREYLTFRDAPYRYAFSAFSTASEDGRVGLYPDLPDGAVSQETDRYAPDAVIEVIWVN